MELNNVTNVWTGAAQRFNTGSTCESKIKLVCPTLE